MALGADPELTGGKGNGGLLNFRHGIELCLNLGGAVGTVQSLYPIHPGLGIFPVGMVFMLVFMLMFVPMLVSMAAVAMVMVVRMAAAAGGFLGMRMVMAAAALAFLVVQVLFLGHNYPSFHRHGKFCLTMGES